MIDFKQEYRAHVEAGMVQEDLDIELGILEDLDYRAILAAGRRTDLPPGPEKLNADKRYYYAQHMADMAALYGRTTV